MPFWPFQGLFKPLHRDGLGSMEMRMLAPHARRTALVMALMSPVRCHAVPRSPRDLAMAP